MIVGRAWMVVAGALALAGVRVATADPGKPLQTVVIPPPAHSEAAKVLYLNRCLGGCTIHKSGVDDARSHSSTIPNGTATDYMMSEFAWGDTEWNAIVQCIKEVYSPYGVTITDQPPTPGVGYNEAIIAGSDGEIGVQAGGIAPITGDCNAYSYVMSYSFANDYGSADRVFTLCAVASQESGHAYGLDHTYSFSDGSSGCKDPMTYRTDCGGEKFFRNDQATCGEFAPRECRCGSTQNSHLKLLSALGMGTPITRPPTVAVTTPAAGATVVNGQTVVSHAGAQRGIAKLELWLNGYLWATTKGTAWGPNGQPDADYGIQLPANVPDGVIDIVVKAKDDIDVETDSQTVTVTKGAPCSSEMSCLTGQRCDDQGRCLWDPAAGQIGDTCSYPQYCLSGVCEGTDTKKICTQSCVPGIDSSCDAGYMCLETSANQGICWPDTPANSGCCSTDDRAAPQAILGALGLAFLVVPWRRRQRR